MRFDTNLPWSVEVRPINRDKSEAEVLLSCPGQRTRRFRMSIGDATAILCDLEVNNTLGTFVETQGGLTRYIEIGYNDPNCPSSRAGRVEHDEQVTK